MDRLKTHRILIAHAAKMLLLAMVAIELYFSLKTFDDVVTIANYDKLMHFAMHAANAMVAALAFPVARVYIFALLLLFLLGPLIELLQHFVPGRDASALDQVANTAGLLLGALLSRWLLSAKAAPRRH